MRWLAIFLLLSSNMALANPTDPDNDIPNNSINHVVIDCLNSAGLAIPYKSGQCGLLSSTNGTPVNVGVTGTTAATTATLAGVASKTTYICGYTIDADATAATVVNATVTGLISGTITRRQGVGAVAAGTVSTYQNYNPCLPASAANTAISVVSGAAGTGGNTAVSAWGYQQ